MNQDEQQQFFRDAGRAIHEIAYLGAKLKMSPDDFDPQRVRVEVMKHIELARRVPQLEDEVARLKHDLESLRTTNEMLGEKLAQPREVEVSL